MNPMEKKAAFLRDPQKVYPLAVRGEGVYVYDHTGKRYLDAIGGVKVVNIGHGVTEIGEAMARQASKIAFAYTGQFLNEAQTTLAERVLSLAPSNMVSAYFTSGGSEGTEIAIKMARQYHLRRGEKERYKVIALWQSYHGATFGALSVTGQTRRRLDYTPYLTPMPHLPPPFCYRCPYGQTYGSCRIQCAMALEDLILREGPGTVSAFIAEPIGGSSANGVSPPPEFFPLVRKICDRNGVLVIVDEVITGFGRTGANFGIMHAKVEPDLMICGKGISSGYAPLGAVLVGDRIFEALSASGPFFMGYTYSGHPVTCAAGVAVLDYMERNKLFERARLTGDYFQKRLQDLQKFPLVGEVRGKGLLAGVEFVADRVRKTPFDRTHRVQERIVALAFQRGIILSAGSGGIANGLMGDDIGVAPPFVIERNEIDHLANVLSECILEIQTQMGIF